MHRLLALVAAAALMLGLAAPAALAAEPTSSNRSVVATIAHDVTIPAGDHVDVVFVVRGHADIAGSVDSIVVIDGTATLTGATANSLVIVNGTADLAAGTRVSGDVRTFDSTVTQSTDSVVGGSVGEFDRNAAAFAVLLIPLFLLLFIGLGLTAMAVALFVAAFAARQVRDAESLISREPGTVLVAGLAGSVVLPILAVLATITIVGAPLGLGILFLVLPVMAFLGWIIAAIWVGDWLLGRSRGAVRVESPVPRSRGRRVRPRHRGHRALRQRHRDAVRVRRAAGDRVADPPPADAAARQRRRGAARSERRLTLDIGDQGVVRDDPGPRPSGASVTPMSGTADGPATTAPSGRPAALLRSFLRSPFQAASWWATVAIGLGFGIAILSGALLSTVFSVGGSLLIWLVGIPIIALGLELAGRFARLERWRMTLVDPRPLVPHPYRPLNGMPQAPYGAWLRTWAEAEFLDASRWLDIVYFLILVPLALLEFVVSVGLWLTAAALLLASILLAVLRPPTVWAPSVVLAFVLGLLLIPVAASVSRGLMRLHRAVVQGLLCVDPAEALRRDNERLRGSRAAALELEASELRRIERDLHDGAQQRLVSLAIDLGRAEERIDSDPVAAKAIVVDARAQARLALAELRDLVRGTMPAILVDRGLEAALASVAAACPVPTSIVSAMAPGERLSPVVERAGYFVVVESLANVAKHSGAGRCEIGLRSDGGTLVIEVRDDGRGGAAVTPGGGLAGLADRAEAIDGTLRLTSPAGGPTVLRVELPLVAR